MRLKSYFAPTVQAAIALARKEFGDEITLVTSHVAPAHARQLGEYEVVFDVEEELRARLAAPRSASTAAPMAVSVAEPVSAVAVAAKVIAAPIAAVPELPPIPLPEPVTAGPFSAFQETLLEAVAPKPAAAEEKAQKLRQIRFTLIELGVEAGLTRAIMSMLEGSIGKRNPRPAGQPITVSVAVAEPATAPVVEAEVKPEPVAAQAPPVAVPAVAAAVIEAPVFEAPVFEVSPQEQAATQSGKVVVISKRRETQNAQSPVVERTPAPGHRVPTAAPTAAELAFISSLAEPVQRHAEKFAVGC